MNASLLLHFGDSKWFTAGYGVAVAAGPETTPTRLIVEGWGGSSTRLMIQGYGDGGSDADADAGASTGTGAALLCSLGGEPWFTAGYTPGAVPSDLVLQGLGRSASRLLTQAYGAAEDDDVPAVIGVRYGVGGLIHDTVYLVYGNDGAGGRIDYDNPRAMVAGTSTSWTSAPLAFPGSYRFAVRARDSATGQDEWNLDAAVTVVLDGTGRDVTAVPHAPLGGRAFALPGGKIRVEWTCPCIDPTRRPLGFNIYAGDGPTLDFSTPSAVVPWSAATAGMHAAAIDNLTPGSPRHIAVRAFNALGEEPIGWTVTATADTTPPTLVEGLYCVPADRQS